ncbi:hypothetical protein DIPPA_19160 [Diplonema papillatum]|nr:hypothetical protein DIPPA_19160 [Diplonema papillatum]
MALEAAMPRPPGFSQRGRPQSARCRAWGTCSFQQPTFFFADGTPAAWRQALVRNRFHQRPATARTLGPAAPPPSGIQRAEGQALEVQGVPAGQRLPTAAKAEPVGPIAPGAECMNRQQVLAASCRLDAGCVPDGEGCLVWAVPRAPCGDYAELLRTDEPFFRVSKQRMQRAAAAGGGGGGGARRSGPDADDGLTAEARSVLRKKKSDAFVLARLPPRTASFAPPPDRRRKSCRRGRAAGGCGGVPVLVLPDEEPFGAGQAFPEPLDTAARHVLVAPDPAVQTHRASRVPRRRGSAGTVLPGVEAADAAHRGGGGGGARRSGPDADDGLTAEARCVLRKKKSDAFVLARLPPRTASFAPPPDRRRKSCRRGRAAGGCGGVPVLVLPDEEPFGAGKPVLPGVEAADAAHRDGGARRSGPDADDGLTAEARCVLRKKKSDAFVLARLPPRAASFAPPPDGRRKSCRRGRAGSSAAGGCGGVPVLVLPDEEPFGAEQAFPDPSTPQPDTCWSHPIPQYRRTARAGFPGGERVLGVVPLIRSDSRLEGLEQRQSAGSLDGCGTCRYVASELSSFDVRRKHRASLSMTNATRIAVVQREPTHGAPPVATLLFESGLRATGAAPADGTVVPLIRSDSRLEGLEQRQSAGSLDGCGTCRYVASELSSFDVRRKHRASLSMTNATRIAVVQREPTHGAPPVATLLFESGLRATARLALHLRAAPAKALREAFRSRMQADGTVSKTTLVDILRHALGFSQPPSVQRAAAARKVNDDILHREISALYDSYCSKGEQAYSVSYVGFFTKLNRDLGIGGGQAESDSDTEDLDSVKDAWDLFRYGKAADDTVTLFDVDTMLARLARRSELRASVLSELAPLFGCGGACAFSRLSAAIRDSPALRAVFSEPPQTAFKRMLVAEMQEEVALRAQRQQQQQQQQLQQQQQQQLEDSQWE